MVVEAYGDPRVLLADNAREFRSDRLKEWCRENGMKLVHSTLYHHQGNAIVERMHGTMKSVLTTVCKGQPTRWPQYIKKCQILLNEAVHDATGEQPQFLMFNRRAPCSIGTELPQISQDSDLEVALDIVRKTSIEQARKWRDKTNIGRKDRRVEEGQLLWVKKDYTTSVNDRKFGVRWIGPYKVKEVLRQGGAYRLENVFDGVMVQRVADRVKQYVGREGVLVQQQEVFGQEDNEQEEELETRPVRQRRPPERYGEE